jgi:periplasmic divalent cation tolerance protein
MLRTLYFTAINRDAALQIARTLVDERLVACANIIDGVTSVYRWKNQTHEDREVVVFAKTTAALAKDAVQRVRQLHDYDCPCVTTWKTAAASDYADWVHLETDKGANG